MLERYGIVTRETVLAEGVPGGFASLYGELQNLEMLGTARRGYFVEGLGGAQFALPGAVERLREAAAALETRLVVLAATDPANPYGAALSWPRREGSRRPARVPGAYLLMRNGEPAIYIERGGKGLQVLIDHSPEELSDALGAIADAGRSRVIPKLAVERVDGASIFESPLAQSLVEAGFERTPRAMTVRPESARATVGGAA